METWPCPVVPSVWLLLGILVCMPLAPASAAPPEDRVDYSATGPAVLEGVRDAHCAFAGHFTRNINLAAQITATALALHWVETEVALTHEGVAAAARPYSQTVVHRDLASSSLLITPGPNPSLGIYLDPNADQAATWNTTSAALEFGAPRATSEGIAHFDPHLDAHYDETYPAPDARVRFDALHDAHVPVYGTPRADVHGDLHILVRDVTLHHPDGTTTTTGPYRTSTTDPAPLPTTLPAERIMLRDLWIIATGAHVTIQDTVGTTLCTTWNATIDGAIDGAMTRYTAAGTYQVGAQTGTVDEAALHLTGTFAVEERIEEQDGAPVATGTANGQITALGQDFKEVITPTPIAPVLTTTGILAGIALLALALLKGPTWLALYSRIDEDKVLDHPARRLLMDYIEANPGSSVAEAARTADLSRSAVKFHLACMERVGLIRTERPLGETMLVPARTPRDALASLFAQGRPPVRYILERTEGRTVPQAQLVDELTKKFGFSAPAARKWLQKCTQAGFVARTGERREVRYCSA